MRKSRVCRRVHRDTELRLLTLQRMIHGVPDAKDSMTHMLHNRNRFHTEEDVYKSIVAEKHIRKKPYKNTSSMYACTADDSPYARTLLR
jgi:hypothetical protein